MSKDKPTTKRLNTEKALNKLKNLWEEIQKIPFKEIEQFTFVKEENLRIKIKELINSRTKALRYAILTQVLAKALDPSINCLAIQAKAPVTGAFDARSFCKKVVVPFERGQLNNILGASSDPYVGKPLRHSMITLDIIDQIKDKKGWKILYTILQKVEEKNDSKFTLSLLKQVLLEIRKLLLKQVVSPPILSFITTEELKEVLVSYLNKPSQGLRPQAVVYAFSRPLMIK